jgi:hypothetical protein
MGLEPQATGAALGGGTSQEGSQGAGPQLGLTGPQDTTQPMAHTSTTLHPASMQSEAGQGTAACTAGQQAALPPGTHPQAAHHRGGASAASAGAAAVHQQLQHAIPGLMSVMDLDALIQQGKALLERADQVSESLAQVDHHDLDALVTNAQDPLAQIDYHRQHSSPTSLHVAPTGPSSPGTTAGQHYPGDTQQWQQWQAHLQGQKKPPPPNGQDRPGSNLDTGSTAQQQPSSSQAPTPGGQHTTCGRRPLVYPLPAVAVKEMMDPKGPYSRTAHPPPMPDVYGTRDMDHVRKVRIWVLRIPRTSTSNDQVYMTLFFLQLHAVWHKHWILRVYMG